MSCLPVSLYADLTAGTRTLEQWFEFAAALGLDGADMSVAHLVSREPAYLAGLRRASESAGAPITMLVTYADFTHPNEDERRRQVAGLRQNIDTAVELGDPTCA
ncbi:MAG: sugar phosphate isomerase/epimerase [Caldilineaceae bacterium]|nr:sugar phosphate isomerase/epimerase [Caldilineaceae bacterium]